jgi:hypothetical protein
MKAYIDKDLILKLNREFHDEVEADIYDARMGSRTTTSPFAEPSPSWNTCLGASFRPKGSW